MIKNKFFIILSALFLFLALCSPGSSSAFAADIKRVVLFDVTPLGDVSKPEIRVTEAYIKESVYQKKNIEIIETGKVKELMKSLNISVVSDSNAFLVGEAFSGDFLLMTTLSKNNNEFKLTIRLLDVKSRKSLFVESEFFDSFADSKNAVNSITAVIFAGEKQLDRSFYISAQARVLFPLFRFANIVNSPGPGVSLSFGVDNLFFNHFNASVECGFFRFSGRLNDSDSISHFPVFFNFGYWFHLSSWLAVSPVAGGGFSWVVVSHGSGKGFIMEENSQDSEVQLSAKFGGTMVFSFFDSLDFVVSVNYHVIFEQSRLGFLNTGFGVLRRL
ncbi:MAG: hypothetical protein GY754_03045 [bacterium]|nr:hypothetical protein [bacterium]